MSTQTDGKALITHLLGELVNERRWADMPEHFTDDFVLHAPMDPEQQPGFAALRRMFDELIAPFPDLRWEIKELVVDDDRVAGHYVMRGTHRGTFQGFAATGRTFAIEEVAFYRIVDGKVAEMWLVPDTFGVAMQLGLVPEGAPPKFLQRLMMMKQRSQDARSKR
jgi:steroid delta-isomerase-like uncharacterized protein